MICEQLGEEPDPNRMPLETSDFPSEVQVAFFIFGFLEDNWEGMSGAYLGKNWNTVEYFFNLYEIENPKLIIFLMKIWESILVSYRAEKAERKKKADERKSARGGKTYAHNVKG